ncbi:hypothetical protein NCS52_01428800 [Fusarium sp. LHS14.1]|nr:hypothetical protein NCS52_01428800 [Fusarium sp. LHS14.1]
MAGMLSIDLGRRDEVSTPPSSLTWANPPIESSDDTPTSTFTIVIHAKLIPSPRRMIRPLKLKLDQPDAVWPCSVYLSAYFVERLLAGQAWRIPWRELCAHGANSASVVSMERKKASGDPDSTQRSKNREQRPLKRRRRASEEDENEPSDRRILQKRSTDDDSFSKFACPFYKRDPANYDDCFRYNLKRIAYVKHNLKRNHRQPTHCEICLEQLPDEDVLHDHIRAQSCRKREYIAPDGMTALQEKKIVSRVGAKTKSASEQWFEIHEILFPGVPRPQSPYLGDRLSEDIEVLRQFMNQRGSVMIVRELQRENFQWASGQEQERQLQTALSRVFDEFLSRQNGSRNGANRGRSSRPERTS